MKYIKNTFCAILILVVLCISNLSIFAHSDILNVDYDDCIVPTNSFLLVLHHTYTITPNGHHIH